MIKKEEHLVLENQKKEKKKKCFACIAKRAAEKRGLREKE